ncbi:hypothetical protein [Falsihalocynthiibacter arcticus]|uniref:N-acetyltransferase domain-containing protein n=1 Tax=Falsihalocynthiibacter arcticus TaxID=1579316 RepID=A0A126V0T0_9RHOB|nr:hypothetical protein [Falsihalocynthiibacter arcticus]AML51900.1 hypothetical protein RC74_12055 [Falsihalocynthiibacter arcticus]
MTTNDKNGQKSITLERFSEANAELVLSWRNAKHVRANSISDDPIRLEDHVAFTKSLLEKRRNFFILRLGDEPQGVINVNELGAGVSLWGCYLAGNRAPRPGIFPMMLGISSVIAFKWLNATELRSEVVSSNVPPQKLNAFVGIELVNRSLVVRSSGEKIELQCYRTTRDQWADVRGKLERLMPTQLRYAFEFFADNPQGAIQGYDEVGALRKPRA